MEGERRAAASRSIRVMRPLATLMTLAVLGSACGGAVSAPRDPLAGEYVAAVSESAIPIAARLTAAFATQHPGMVWTVKDLGSAATLALIAGGEADVGFISREVTVADEKVVQALGIGYTAQVLIVHPSNPVTALSKEQLRGIFGGGITDWSQVGGTGGTILVALRAESSPTRTALDPLLRPAGASYRPDAITTPDAEAMVNTVAASPRAIGMVSALHLAGLASPLRMVAIDGVAPTKTNTANGVYPYRRPITLVLRANTSLIRPGAKQFRDWVHGEEGQRILRELF